MKKARSFVVLIFLLSSFSFQKTNGVAIGDYITVLNENNKEKGNRK